MLAQGAHCGCSEGESSAETAVERPGSILLLANDDALTFVMSGGASLPGDGASRVGESSRAGDDFTS